MWFNDIDIRLRYPSWPPRVESVAPRRHRVALERYLERKTRREMGRRRYEFEDKAGTMRAWVEALRLTGPHFLNFTRMGDARLAALLKADRLRPRIEVGRQEKDRPGSATA